MNERAFLFAKSTRRSAPFLLMLKTLIGRPWFAAERESRGIHHLEIAAQRLVEGDFVIHRGCRILFRISRIDAVDLGGLENDVGTHFLRRAALRSYPWS